MAKRKGSRRPKSTRSARKAKSARRSVKRPSRKRRTRPSSAPKSSARKPARKPAARKPAARRRSALKPAARKTEPRRTAARQPARAGARPVPRPTTRPLGPGSAPGRTSRTKVSRIDRVRRRLEEGVPTPPSSLDLERHPSAARTGRDELEERLQEHGGMSPRLTGGDVDADWEEAYFTGDEAPGGDNPTPDQDIVENVGRSLGVDYQDNEELKSTDKIEQRDKHRWELDPASSEDYKDRK